MLSHPFQLLHHDRPYVSLLITFLAWKSLILIIVLLSPGRGYDTSTTVLPSFLNTPTPSGLVQRALRHLTVRVVRWDAIYFTQIAERGYVYEQEWAFGWGHTGTLRLLAGFIGPALGYDQLNTDVIALAGVLLAHSCHAASVVLLYWLTKEVFQHEEKGRRQRMALVAALLHILSPAGVFLSAPYAEAPFALMNFLGMYVFVKAVGARRQGREVEGTSFIVLVGGLFGLATLLRGNGLFSGLTIVAYALETCLSLLRRQGNFVILSSRLAITGASGVLMAGLASWPQILAYKEYCLHPEAEELRPWCTSSVPSIYAWVQKDNWGVGFLRYWTLSNVPLFLLASPMLSIMFVSCKWALNHMLLPGRSNTIPKGKDSARHHDSGNDGHTTRRWIFYLCLPQLLLAFLAFTTYHVQIITRLSSGYPVWYWWLGSLLVDGSQYGGPGGMSTITKAILISSCVSENPPPQIPSIHLSPFSQPTEINYEMEHETLKMAELLASMQAGMDGDLDSRATSPGRGGQEQRQEIDLKQVKRSRPRTYPYFRYLPYETEKEEERKVFLEETLKQLYICIEAGDFAVGAVHWTRTLRNWLDLKFDLTKDQRIRLVKVFYELSLAPGVDVSAAEKFANTFVLLLKRKHYLQPGAELTLDWRPLFRELKVFVMPSESNIPQSHGMKRSYRTLGKMCTHAQTYFDPEEIPKMFEEILPYFTVSLMDGAYVVAGLLNLLLPTSATTTKREDLMPQHYLPTLFHLWSLVSRSKVFDQTFLDLFSRLARDHLSGPDVPFSEFGIFTEAQSSTIFTAILRLLDIPVGQATSPYSAVSDAAMGLAVYLERDSRKHPSPQNIARWIVMSLSPESSPKPKSIMSNLEGLIQAVETFFHPSNSGGWTRTLSQLVHHLTDFFVLRYNRESRGETHTPESRKIDNTLKRRFVLCLREVVFMGIFAKSGSAMDLSLTSLHNLAYLEPTLILPGALQRIYPSMQGLVEVHRTTSSLRALQVLSKILVRTKGFRCHVTTLLGLALPGIDANDLDKTLYTLSFIQAVCYNIPFQDLTVGREDISGQMLAMDWISGEVTRMEQEGVDVQLNYEDDLTDDIEEQILRSSTAGFGEFLTSFLGKVFALVENLPDAARNRSGSAEENVINTLPATFLPLLASLSPELYDVALNKIADFIGNHVIHQARDAMAFICSALAKTNPEKALKRLVPPLVGSIRSEIDENGAASTRYTGSEVLPRDRGLVWNVSMLSMCIVHVGEEVLSYRKELLEVACYMQEKCKGVPTLHVSNLSHHLLLNLTGTYTVDWKLFEEDEISKGLGPQHWGAIPDPHALDVKWHVPNREEIAFALDLVKAQGSKALNLLRDLISDKPAFKRDGVGKEWSDEVSRNLMLVRLIISGLAVTFNPKDVDVVTPQESEESDVNGDDSTADEQMEGTQTDEQREEALANSNDDSVKPVFPIPVGFNNYDDEVIEELHTFRGQVGRALHDIHTFLVKNQEDDVSCFSPLYSAYRSWFIDVGLERSAKVLDRNIRLYQADVFAYKLSGLRKHYPRPLLVRRALVYHLQRLRHNAYPRRPTELAKQLLFDLVESAVSFYVDVRKHAQTAGESAFKAIVGSRSLVLPRLVTAFEKGVKEGDYPRIKGTIHSLLFSTLTRPIARNWTLAPSVIRSYLAASTVDRASVQRLCSSAAFSIMDIGRPLERVAILDKEIIEMIAPSEEVATKIKKKEALMIRQRTTIEKRKSKLSDELVQQARSSHWKQASRTAAIVVSLGMRFDYIASDDLVDLLTRGAVDEHPGLRALYSGAFAALLTLVESRAAAKHTYENYLMDKANLPAKIKVRTHRDNTDWTDRFMGQFAQAEAEYYVDLDHPGWLVWTDSISAYKTNPETDLVYDDTENRVRRQVGSYLDRHWFSKAFANIKQEPRDASDDRFHISNALFLAYTFELMNLGETKAGFSEIKEEIEKVFGDGSDKHEHRATAEILAGLLASAIDKPIAYMSEMWAYAFPIFSKIFADGLTPENVGYWTSFLHFVLHGRDPRRNWPVVDWLASFRLDMESNAAFKEGCKVRLLQQCISDIGWHFQLEKPIREDFLQHIDHPYKGVREAVGQTLAAMYRTRYHESYRDVTTLMEAQKSSSSLGTKPYEPTQDFKESMVNIFDRIEQWRKERVPGQQTPSAYTSGSKTVLLWLDTSLASAECTQYTQFFPSMFLEHLLHMMDIKEDQELQGLAYHVFRHIPNIPHRTGEDADLIAALIRIGRTSPLWHQRLRVLINMQVIFFRRIFLISSQHQQDLFACVASMLEDPQLEVRLGASSTLSGMIRCSPGELRDHFIDALNTKFTTMLEKNPLPKRARNGLSATNSGTGTPTPEHNRLVLTRHAAVLGLGALVSAFPYTSPPPKWIPGVLATLARKANNDPGTVGKSVKSILSDFKKTRQDTWQIDLKAFSQEQAEDLDGVLWKSYFA